VQTYVPSSEVREQYPLAINLEVARESGVELRLDRVGPTFPNLPPTCRLAELMGREPVAARPGGSNQAQSTPVASSVGGADLNWRTAVALVRP
jgi:hypothetical protein